MAATGNPRTQAATEPAAVLAFRPSPLGSPSNRWASEPKQDLDVAVVWGVNGQTLVFTLASILRYCQGTRIHPRESP